MAQPKTTVSSALRTAILDSGESLRGIAEATDTDSGALSRFVYPWRYSRAKHSKSSFR